MKVNVTLEFASKEDAVKFLSGDVPEKVTAKNIKEHIAANPVPTETATPAPAPEPVAEASAPAAPAGIELDSDGMPWDKRIHSGSKAKVSDGTWKKRRGIDPDEKAKIESELRMQMAANGLTPTPVADTPAPVAPPVAEATAPVAPPVAEATAPVAPPVAEATAPVAPPVAEAANPITESPYYSPNIGPQPSERHSPPVPTATAPVAPPVPQPEATAPVAPTADMDAPTFVQTVGMLVVEGGIDGTQLNQVLTAFGTRNVNEFANDDAKRAQAIEMFRSLGVAI